MIFKTVAAVIVGIVVGTTAHAQNQPTYFDRAAYVTCREAQAMSPEARKSLATYLAEHAAQFHGVIVPNDERGAQLAYLVRGGCTLAPDAYLFTVINRAILAEMARLPKR
jgi:hypothetical protein